MTRRNQALKRTTTDMHQIKDPVEKAFMVSLQSAEAYIRLEDELSTLVAHGGAGGSGELKREDFENLLQPFCRACWEECERSFAQNADTGFYAAARAETELLRKQLTTANLSCLKQVTGMRSGGHSEQPLGEDTVTFFEPLQHMDEETRELVYLLIAEKVGQISKGSAPNSLVAAICKAVKEGHVKKRRMSGEPGGDDADHIADLRDEIEDLEERLQSAEDKAATIEVLKDQAEERAREADNRLAQVTSESSQLQAEVERLQEEAAQRAAELEQARESLGKVESSLSEAESHISALGEARVTIVDTEAMDRLPALEAELREVTATAAEARKRVEELEVSRRELQAKALKLEQEAAHLRQELERSGRLVQATAQSSHAAEQITNLEAENKRLKLALEELRAKLGELMKECRNAGISAEKMDEITDSCGLKTLMKATSVFENLYQDAMDRVGRLEKLRERYRMEKQKSFPRHPLHLVVQDPASWAEQPMDTAPDSPMGPCSPAGRQSLGVLEALQESDLSETTLAATSAPGVEQVHRFLMPALEEFEDHASLAAARRASQPAAPAMQWKPAMSAGALAEPAVGSPKFSTLQRAQALRVQGQFRPPPQSSEPADATLAAAGYNGWNSALSPLQKPVVAMPSAPPRARAVPPPSQVTAGSPTSPQSGGRVAVFAPSPRDISAEAGNELARRLATSTSLPSLHRPVPSDRHGKQGGGGGAFLNRPSGLSNFIGGRDAGWK